MNPTAMTVTPPAAAQGTAAPGKSGDAAATDTPFAQVFSGELARKAGAKADDDRDATLNVLPADALASLAASASRETLPDEPPAADATTLPTGDALPQSEMLLALGMPGDGPKPRLPADAVVAGAGGEKPVTVADVLGARGGARGAAQVAEMPGARPAVASRPDSAGGAVPTASGTPTPAPDAASTAPVAAQRDAAPAGPAFAERLAAARQAEPGNASERVAELMSHPALRAVAHAAPDLTTAADPAASRLAPSVGSTAWGHALGDKLVWMAAGSQQTASLTLNPPNLGPVHVVLNVSNDQATASFFAAQPEVRQALESAFPKLREMMSDAGIQLGQTTVSAETPRQQDAPQRDTPRGVPELGQASHATGADAVPVPASAALRQMGRGLVDRFA